VIRDNADWIGRREHDSKDRTARTKRDLEKNSGAGAAEKGQLGEEICTGQLGTTVQIGQAKQERQDRPARLRSMDIPAGI
jgi:hypothetical protein